MILKEYDLEEEKRNYPHSVHRCRVEEDLIGMSARHIANKV